MIRNPNTYRIFFSTKRRCPLKYCFCLFSLSLQPEGAQVHRFRNGVRVGSTAMHKFHYCLFRRLQQTSDKKPYSDETYLDSKEKVGPQGSFKKKFNQRCIVHAQIYYCLIRAIYSKHLTLVPSYQFTPAATAQVLHITGGYLATITNPRLLSRFFASRVTSVCFSHASQYQIPHSKRKN